MTNVLISHKMNRLKVHFCVNSCKNSCFYIFGLSDMPFFKYLLSISHKIQKFNSISFKIALISVLTQELNFITYIICLMRLLRLPQIFDFYLR